ncbi:SDR family oxidoreductase [Sphingopyxis panaciterrulae]|uniref:NAD(P)-dependent dehydrogenase (Short-subunit alcohol dehydrogenase family) n=1 Tax=Sphingopyxis panaciterrulae TaxID=462372 RepID=A0A7W9B707_9SPHN|nr:SDR family oxidoreductase [Sphingopyxis panaciterrulae]MBB5707450.1 NAD(P)-dependent dehydrogenase (short-subunit alcohol dehydrogenase family) [Sphingopyxis panaciterrulae]
MITGGAGVLGRTLARLLLDRGFEVAIADRREAALARAREWLGAPAALVCLPLDVSDARSWNAVVEAAGPIDFLVNNACPPSARKELLAMDADEWRAMIDTGLTGAFLGIRSFVPAMVERGGGRVLNIASLAALGAAPRHGDYAAAKAALVSLSDTLRSELAGTGVSVSVACPGAIGRPVGEGSDPAGCATSRGRMDPANGMAHVLDRAMAGDFLILTHRDSGELAALRGRELAAALAATPQGR